jgi:hypothetical protein
MNPRTRANLKKHFNNIPNYKLMGLLKVNPLLTNTFTKGFASLMDVIQSPQQNTLAYWKIAPISKPGGLVYLVWINWYATCGYAIGLEDFVHLTYFIMGKLTHSATL